MADPAIMCSIRTWSARLMRTSSNGSLSLRVGDLDDLEWVTLIESWAFGRVRMGHSHCELAIWRIWNGYSHCELAIRTTSNGSLSLRVADLDDLEWVTLIESWRFGGFGMGYAL
jgi:hypothetical protein